jgi:hypothetical protein
MQPGAGDKQQQQSQKTPLRKGLYLGAVVSHYQSEVLNKPSRKPQPQLIMLILAKFDGITGE